MEPYVIKKPVPYYDQLYHTIKKMILDGVYKPGERIVESKLAKELNLSRTPIREAIRALENEGLVLLDEKSRVIVYSPTVEDVEDVYQCRMALESLAVKLTIQRASDHEIGEIENILQQADRKIGQKDYLKDEVIDLNVQFHNLIIQFSRNNLLQKHLNSIKSRIHLYRVLNFQGENRDRAIYNEHKEIFDWMKQRNEDKASEAMVNHLVHDYHHLIEVLKSQSG
ncbi:GntR family transcriptional regulator [Paenibacillus hamazuiensis]|uniref:GntR family transcriptional regulator n=1 Tax=Paenibacillus hamazuiensis TaxID=2936508 RepID=UPI00200E53B2|nr:GntR family transcriptional regulator [Paenibacillus hamazuiensis]